MKLLMFFLTAFLSFTLFTFNPAYAERRCFGPEELEEIMQNKGRFKHCKKGDIISVYSVTLKEGFPKKEVSLNDIRSFAIRENEVASFCSFDNQIVSLGKTEIIASALIGSSVPVTVQWFDCVYIGKERENILTK